MTDLVDLLSFVFNIAAGRWTSSGRFVAESAVVSEMERVVGSSRETMRVLTKQLYSGQIELSQWQTASALELRDAHSAFAMLGAGGRSAMQPANWGKLGSVLKGQYGHLGNFAEQIAAGGVSEAQALARINQYGQAVQSSYWRETAKARTKGLKLRGLPKLNQAPRDGKTRCKGNCKCQLGFTKDGISWNLTVAEHYPDCEALAAGGPYQPGRL